MKIGEIDYPRLRVRRSRRGVRYYFDHGGKPRRWQPIGNVESVAIKRYEALIAAPRPGRGTVAEMLTETLTDLESREGDEKLATGTLLNYRGYAKHLAAVFERPETITQADVLRYLKACPRKSFKNEVGLLSMGFALWMDQGRLTFNPCFGVKSKRKGSKRTRLLTWAEVDRIIAKADERTAVAIELALALGLRISDCCRLRWRDVDEYLDTLKTGRRLAWERSDSLDTILARAKAIQARVASMHVLCDRRGRPWRTGTLRDHWDAAVKAAGIEDAHFHDLRARAGSEIEKLYGREAAQHFLGHKSPTTTDGYLRDKRVHVVKTLARKLPG